MEKLIFFEPYVSQADLCRLGRDYIGAGKYTDMVFPSLGCRFIALNDGVDTIHKNNEMLVILKNMMNGLYARDTSNKIRAVKRSPFKTGKYVECYAPMALFSVAYCSGRYRSYYSLPPQTLLLSPMDCTTHWLSSAPYFHKNTFQIFKKKIIT